MTRRPPGDAVEFWGEDRPRWHADAACQGMDVEDFFPVGTTGPALDRIRWAKKICEVCPVRQPCLDYALDTGQVDGIWGGMSQDERRSERRRRAQRRRRNELSQREVE